MSEPEEQSTMPEPQNIIPPALERWLRVATRDLGEQARTDIQVEATRRYHKALEAKLARGKSRAVAEAAALKALGTPFDLGLSRERQCLKENDIEFLKRFIGNDETNVKTGLLVLLVYTLLMGLNFIFNDLQSALRVAVLIFLVPLFFALKAWLVRRLAIRSIRGRLAAENLLFLAIVCACYLHSRFIALKPHDLVDISAMSFLVYLGRSLLILRTLGKKPRNRGKALDPDSPVKPS